MSMTFQTSVVQMCVYYRYVRARIWLFPRRVMVAFSVILFCCYEPVLLVRALPCRAPCGVDRRMRSSAAHGAMDGQRRLIFLRHSRSGRRRKEEEIARARLAPPAAAAPPPAPMLPPPTPLPLIVWTAGPCRRRAFLDIQSTHSFLPSIPSSFWSIWRFKVVVSPSSPECARRK